MRSRLVWKLGIAPVFALALVACGGGTATPEPVGEPAADQPAAVTFEEPSVSVADQDASDGNVVIEDVDAAQDGWIVIHVTRDGGPGPVIGFAPVEAGENHDVEVEIDLEQATGQLFAMLHLDAGTEGTYEFPGDDRPVKVGDSIVNVSFQVTFPVEPAVTVSDQDVSEGTAIIDKVAAAEPGWLVIHSARDGAPGPVIGHAPVGIGNNSEVAVAIDLDKATQQLFAMLHLDAGTQGEYEFPGDDAPVRVDETVVVKPFAAEFPVEPSVSVSDQDFSDGTVTVDNVAAGQPGWLVIHVDDDGAPGAVIGHAAVEAGNNPGLEVGIDAAAATPKLFAMLHLDAGTAGEYEFPGDDGPVSVDDAVVVVPFNLVEGSASPPSESTTVMVLDYRFSSKEITVPVGTTVVWRMEASVSHTVTADDGSFDSGTLNTGDTFSYTFETEGTLAYFCEFHGGRGGEGMSGVVNVSN